MAFLQVLKLVAISVVGICTVAAGVVWLVGNAVALSPMLGAVVSLAIFIVFFAAAVEALTGACLVQDGSAERSD